MKLDYDKFPILKKLTLDNPTILLNEEKFPTDLLQVLKRPITNAKESLPIVHFISKPFYEAVRKASCALKDILVKESFAVECNDIYCIDYGSGIRFTIIFMVSGRGEDRHGYVQLYDRRGFLLTHTIILSDDRIDLMETDHSELKSAHAFSIAVSMWLFKKYAQVELKTLFKRRKTYLGAVQQENNTDFDIIHLDSTWFTTLVRSEGFGVSGHFRLQPCKKDGNWTRELIWINEFQKTGYTRKAGILASKQVNA